MTTDDVLKEEELARRIAVRLPSRDMRTIKKFLRGEPIKGNGLKAELEHAKVEAEAEMAKVRK